MYDLSNKEKLEFIIKKSKELDITAYEYGENTILTATGARNILNGSSENPRTKNLNAMLKYLEKKVLGTAYQPENTLRLVSEPSEHHKKEDIPPHILKKIQEIEKRISILEAKI